MRFLKVLEAEAGLDTAMTSVAMEPGIDYKAAEEEKATAAKTDVQSAVDIIDNVTGFASKEIRAIAKQLGISKEDATKLHAEAMAAIAERRAASQPQRSTRTKRNKGGLMSQRKRHNHGNFEEIIAEEEDTVGKPKQSVLQPSTSVLSETQEAIPVEVKKPTRRSIFDEVIEESTSQDTEEAQAVQATKNTMSNTAIQDAALRFARDRLGQEDITQEEAMAEYIEHFRSFNVNELTAAGDFNMYQPLLLMLKNVKMTKQHNA